jgi:hypothetical protein
LKRSLTLPRGRERLSKRRIFSGSTVLAHRDYGPSRTLRTREDAKDELDEPTWVGAMRVEPFELVVEDGDWPATSA